MEDIDAVVYYEKPLLTFERLLETYLAISPRGLRSFIAAMQVWLKEKLFLKYEIKNNLIFYVSPGLSISMNMKARKKELIN